MKGKRIRDVAEVDRLSQSLRAICTSLELLHPPGYIPGAETLTKIALW